MINKKLLSEVLGYDVQKYAVRKNNIIPFQRNKVFKDALNVRNPINIHELAHMCKEWAYSREYLIDSRVTQSGACRLFTSPISEKKDVERVFTAKTEPEAIFKACEWILDNQ